MTRCIKSRTVSEDFGRSAKTYKNFKKEGEVLYASFLNSACSTVLDPFIVEGVYTAWYVPPTNGNWSLAQLEGPNAEAFKLKLAEEIRSRGIRRVFAPTVKYFSGVVVEQEQLDTVIKLPYGIKIYRNAALPCDGVILRRGDAFIMSGGGCPIVIAFGVNNKGEMILIVCHVGAASALDPFCFGEGRATEAREYFSAINSIVAMARLHGLEPRNMVLRCLFQISTEGFVYPLTDSPFAKVNRRKYDFFAERYPNHEVMPFVRGVTRLDLGSLIQLQARDEGVHQVFTDERVLPHNGIYADTRHANPILKDSKNLGIVHFHG